jgi:predicted nucleotidyltransferase
MTGATLLGASSGRALLVRVKMTLDGLNDDFRDIVVLFADRGVEFVIVGAYALAFHGAPRASGDIDLYIRPSSENAERVFEALQSFGAPLASHGVVAADFSRPGTIYQIGLPPRRIDVLTEVSGLGFDEVWASRVAALVDGRTVHIIGRDAFVRNKTAAGRPKDMADVARLAKKTGK